MQIGEAAYNVSLKYHYLDTAKEIAKNLLDIARNNAEKNDNLNAMRKFSVSLARYGKI
jgi:hypothetical protein